MSAHLRPLRVQCDEPGCRSAAREELRNTYNAALGQFCRRHARQHLAEVLRGERRGA